MEQSLGLTAKNNFQLVKNLKSVIKEVAISSIIPRKYRLAENETKMNNMIETSCKKDERIKFVLKKIC